MQQNSPRIDSRIESRIESRIDSRIDSRINSRINPRINSRINWQAHRTFKTASQKAQNSTRSAPKQLCINTYIASWQHL